MGKLVWLWIKYLYYLLTFQQCQLITEDAVYNISPEAIRGFRMTLNQTSFLGTINGLEVDFIISMERVITIRRSYVVL